MASELSFINRALGIDRVFPSRRDRGPQLSAQLQSRPQAAPGSQAPLELQGAAQLAAPPALRQQQAAQQPAQAAQLAQPVQGLRQAAGPAQAPPTQVEKGPGAPAPKRDVRRRLQKAQVRGSRLKARRKALGARRDFRDRQRQQALGGRSQDNRRRNL